tara:strand:+ start:1082 stop:1411 length:330 start_codon:yes stop_codon:yes gene_type:complete
VNPDVSSLIKIIKNKRFTFIKSFSIVEFGSINKLVKKGSQMAEEIEFYDVKERKKVSVSLENVTKTKYERKLSSGKTQTRYAFRGKVDSRQLTKFCSQKDWEATSVPQE